MTTWLDVVAGQGLGTSTTATKLDGALTANASDYTVPSPAQTLVAVRPKLWETTPTANQSVVATLSITSKANYIGDFDLLCNPLDAGLGTIETQLAESARWYPCNIPLKANSLLSFFGQAQVANTVAPIMSCDLLLSDAPPTGAQMHYINNGQGYGNAMTSTGTAIATVAGNAITITGSAPVNIRAFYALAVETTPVASKPIAGYFTFSSPSFQTFPNPQRLNMEPITGMLGATTVGNFAKLSHGEGLDLPVTKMPANITTSATFQSAPSTAGAFMQGCAYVYA